MTCTSEHVGSVHIYRGLSFCSEMKAYNMHLCHKSCFHILFYILASNSLRNVVMCIWAKINFSDFNYSIAIHLLGKLEREFRKGIVDRNWKFPLVWSEHIGWRIQDNFRGRVRCQIGLLHSIGLSWVNAVTYTLYKGY